jgi:hypothetical protein
LKNHWMAAAVVSLMLILTACDQLSPQVANPTEPVPEVTVEVPEATVEAAATEEPAPGSASTTDQAAAGAPIDVSDYTFAVSMLIRENLPVNTPPPPEGYVWVLGTASVANRSEQSIAIEQENVRLIDDQGNVYEAEAPDSGTQPPLIGATLPPGGNQRVFVRFAVPEGANLAEIQWCLATCDTMIAQPVHNF